MDDFRTGSFNSTTIENQIYTPSEADFNLGEIELTAAGTNSGTNSVTNSESGQCPSDPLS